MNMQAGASLDTSMRTVTVLFLAVLLLAACATPYGERDFRDVGWSEVQLEPNVYALDYAGDGHQTLSLLEEYWHRRANARCPNGYDIKESPQFITQSSDQGRARSELITTPPPNARAWAGGWTATALSTSACWGWGGTVMS